MDTTQTTEYAVHVSHYAVNGTERWKAFVEAFPQITAEGPTCEAVLEEIGEKLQSRLPNAGNTATPATEPLHGAESLSPSELAELDTRLKAMGHSYYGIFADDPGALEVFDEIERLRDQQQPREMNQTGKDIRQCNPEGAPKTQSCLGVLRSRPTDLGGRWK